MSSPNIPVFRLLCIGMLLAPVAQAFHLPKFEWGVGVGSLRLPQYRGARGYSNYALPIPHVVYRGDLVRMDDEGLRGRLFESERLRLDLSVAGNVPVRNPGSGPRTGMPSLDLIVEVGPTVDATLWRSGRQHGGGEWDLQLRTPVRAALSVGQPLVQQQGWVFSPSLDLRFQRGAGHAHWHTKLSIGPLYATRRYHDYFYRVKNEYATPQREAYRPTGGYSGRRAVVSLAITTQRWFIGAFARYDQLAGAVFADSPLVETQGYFALGAVVSRKLGRSEQRASH
ncbi:MAG: MipA/OmpV family protein [Gammaproteobacteria bacterium]|nr:MipA/OmpV family protein [Gammaproteobacteria bacterium]